MVLGKALPYKTIARRTGSEPGAAGSCFSGLAGRFGGSGNGKTKTRWLWTYVRDDRPWGDKTPPAVWFAYTPDRKGEHPKAHWREFTGTLQADGYAGYDAVYEGGPVEEVACMAHIRRPFYDLYEAHKSAVAKEALERIAALYVIEEEIRGRSAGARREIRNLRSRSLLDSLEQWFQETLGKLSTKSDTTKAIRYALGRWNELMRFCDDGHLEIDNSAAERSLRTVVLGRKNYLFHGSDAGGERAAAIYGLIGTALTALLAKIESKRFAPCGLTPPKYVTVIPNSST